MNYPNKVVVGGWGPWKSKECKSECLAKSMGYQVKERKCNNPVPLNTDKGCEGPSYEHVLCKDSDICQSKRRAAVEYASEKCKSFAKRISELDPKGQGLQSPHEEGKMDDFIMHRKYCRYLCYRSFVDGLCNILQKTRWNLLHTTFRIK